MHFQLLLWRGGGGRGREILPSADVVISAVLLSAGGRITFLLLLLWLPERK